MTKKKSGDFVVFESNDDLDFSIKSDTQYQRLLNELSQKYPWQEQPVTYIAVDSLFFMEESTKRTTYVETFEYQPVDPDVIKKIMQDSAVLLPLQPKTNLQSGDWDSTIGYYIAFDDVAFKRLYHSAVANSRTVNKEERIVEDSEKAQVYRSRHYIEIPLKASETIPTYECSISTKRTFLPNSKIFFRLNNDNIPLDSNIDIFVDGKIFKTIPLTEEPIHIGQNLSIGTHKISIEIHQKDDETICSDSASIQIKKPKPVEPTNTYKKSVRLGGGVTMIDYNYRFFSFSISGLDKYSMSFQVQGIEESAIFLGLNKRNEFSAKTNSFNTYIGFQVSNNSIPIKVKFGIRPEFSLSQHEYKFIWIDAGVPYSRDEMGLSFATGLGWLY